MQNKHEQTNNSSSQMEKQLTQTFVEKGDAIREMQNVSKQVTPYLLNGNKAIDNLIKVGQQNSTLSGNPNRFNLNAGKTQPITETKQLNNEQQDKVENQDDMSHNVTGNLSL